MYRIIGQLKFKVLELIVMEYDFYGGNYIDINPNVLSLKKASGVLEIGYIEL